jgi:hypothetical protein
VLGLGGDRSAVETLEGAPSSDDADADSDGGADAAAEEAPSA